MARDQALIFICDTNKEEIGQVTYLLLVRVTDKKTLDHICSLRYS